MNPTNRPDPRRPIALIGLPGSGKSTVSRQLARRLDSAVVDTDELIERRLGESIRTFFEREGEAAFRDLESVVLEDALSRAAPADVIATGGGIVLRESNREALRQGTTVIYLLAQPEDLFRRLRHDTKRPLLQGDDPLGRLRDLYIVRDPLYRQTADFLIETGRPGVRSLVNLVLMQLELAGRVEAGSVASPV